MDKLIKLLLITLIFKQVVWIAFIPLWQYPDEQAHFGQVAYQVESHKNEIPDSRINLSEEILLSEQILGTERDNNGNNRFTYHPEFNIDYGNSLDGLHEKDINNFPVNKRGNMVKAEATGYRSIYYVPGRFIYELFYENNLFIRVFLIRLFNILYYLLTIYFVYKAYKLIFRNNLFALSGSLIIAFHPMFSFLMGGINLDNLFNLLSTAIIYYSLEMIFVGVNIRRIIISIVLVTLAIYTKLTAYILIIFFLFPIFLNFLKKSSVTNLLKTLILTFLVSFPFIQRRLTTSLYIPEFSIGTIIQKNLPFFQYLNWTIKHTYREILPWYWGVFRWLSLALPRTANRLINRITLILFIGIIIYLIKTIKHKRFNKVFVAFSFLLYTSLIFFMAITVWDYLFTLTHGFSFGIQGRYFFPTIASHIGILTFGIVGFSSKLKIQKILAGILSGGMIILHELALFKLLFSYFSIESISKFFIQASQYKPWFFKSPVLEFIILIHLITLLIFFYEFINRIFSHEKAVS